MEKIIESLPLASLHDRARSFNGKAYVATTKDNCKLLYSYGECVARYANGQFAIDQKHTPTTTRHQLEFARQFYNRSITAKQLSDYAVGKIPAPKNTWYR